MGIGCGRGPVSGAAMAGLCQGNCFALCQGNMLRVVIEFCLCQGNLSSNAAMFFLDFLTFWILYSYLVPISLFVTIEIVKFWQVSLPLGSPALVACQ
jgi:hypothetical protein